MLFFVARNAGRAHFEGMDNAFTAILAALAEILRLSFRVVEIVDTRDYDAETGKPIPSTGEDRACSRCGAAHQVWVKVAGYSNKARVGTMIVGTSCARGMVAAADLNRVRRRTGNAVANDAAFERMHAMHLAELAEAV